MTRNSKSTGDAHEKQPPSRTWMLQEAKARFSELVRRARSEGPQHVTVHGREEVVVMAVETFHRLQDNRTGVDLIAAMRALPCPDLNLNPRRDALPVRDVVL